MRPVRRTSSPSTNMSVFAKEHGSNLILFEIHGDARNAMPELDQFARHDLLETMNAGNAIAHRHDRARLGNIDGALVILNLLPENTGNLVRSDVSHNLA